MTTWPVPGGSLDRGRLGQRHPTGARGLHNSEIYVIDTRTGALKRIAVGTGPHGLCVFLQPGKISLGHTGNYR